MSGAWRVGRKLGRTLYLDDHVVGMVDTPELAARIVEALNCAPVPTCGLIRSDGAPCDKPEGHSGYCRPDFDQALRDELTDRLCQAGQMGTSTRGDCARAVDVLLPVVEDWLSGMRTRAETARLRELDLHATVTEVLIGHQRRDERDRACTCGWGVWGGSFAEHLADHLLPAIAAARTKDSRG